MRKRKLLLKIKGRRLYIEFKMNMPIDFMICHDWAGLRYAVIKKNNADQYLIVNVSTEWILKMFSGEIDIQDFFLCHAGFTEIFPGKKRSIVRYHGMTNFPKYILPDKGVRYVPVCSPEENSYITLLTKKAQRGAKIRGLLKRPRKE